MDNENSRKEKKSKLKNYELTEFLLYTTPNGDVKVEIFLMNETVWLSQKKIAELFGVDVSTINEHLKNIYLSGELTEEATIGKFPIVQQEGNLEVKREVQFYNLDAFLQFNERDILNHPGKVSAVIAKAFAESELEKYRIVQDRLYESDFDKEMKNITKESSEQPSRTNSFLTTNYANLHEF